MGKRRFVVSLPAWREIAVKWARGTRVYCLGDDIKKKQKQEMQENMRRRDRAFKKQAAWEAKAPQRRLLAEARREANNEYQERLGLAGLATPQPSKTPKQETHKKIRSITRRRRELQERLRLAALAKPRESPQQASAIKIAPGYLQVSAAHPHPELRSLPVFAPEPSAEEESH